MRRVEGQTLMSRMIALSVWVTLIAGSLAIAFPLGAAAQATKETPEKYLPIHAVLSIRGTALTQGDCTAHGFIVVWEGDLEATDDDPEGIFPAASYERFDAPFTTLNFDDWACGEGEGRSTCTHKLGRKPSAAMRLVLVGVNDETGESGRTQFVDFHSFELGYIHCSDVVTEPMAILMSALMGPGNLVPPLALTEEDFARGFDRMYHFGGTCDSPEPAPFACGHDGDYRVEGTLTLSYKQDTDKPKVEIAGCAHLVLGGSDQLTATGTPSGGRYRWTSETPSVLSVSGTESSTDVKAGEPGHATVRVEYEARNGKKTEATLAGSVVTLTSVNGGAAIPTLYLYDAYGNPRPPTEVPTVQDPPDGDLLNFEVADPGVATVMNMGSSLLLQGVREGTTTAQAQTKCGEKTGPVITLTVARCDPEMIAKLHKRYDEIRKKRDESASRVNKAITSKEYIESSDAIRGDVIDVGLQVIDIAAAGASGLSSATKAVHIADKVIAGGVAGWDVSRSEVEETLIKTAVIVTIPLGGASLVSNYEKVHAVAKLVEHTGVLLDAAETIEREQPIQDGYSKELDQIDKLIEKCKKGSEGGQPPKKEPTTPKPKVEPPAGKKGGEKPKPGEPTTPTPKPGEPSTPTEPDEPGGGKTGGDEPPPPPPPPEPPTRPGGTVGLPIDCGCKEASTASWKNKENGLAAIAASLGLLQACAENYENALKSFQADSAGMTQTRSAIETALDTPGEKGFKQFSAAVPGLGAAGKSWERLSKASTEFSNTLQGCDKKTPEAAGLIKKAGQALGTTTPEGVKR
jgi:hypothetical protein